MRALPHTKSCFVCGETNRSGLRLKFETDGKIVRCRFLPGAEFVGFRDTIHGGITATLLDEVMVWACAVASRRFAFCAELTVRYQQPVRPGVDCIATAELVTNRRDKLFEAKAELRDMKGTLLTSATGKYLAMKDADAGEMARDFVGDFSEFVR